MTLTDVKSLCAFARYCDPNGQVWSLVAETDNAEARRDFVRQTCDCPSGRLAAWDSATSEAIELHYEPSIGLVEDPAQDCSGPLWLRGGIAVISATRSAIASRFAAAAPPATSRSATVPTPRSNLRTACRL
jgi:hypothetical protein